MAREIGALSGRELSIDEDLIGRAIVMERTPGFDPTRVCFLVSDEEWDELERINRSLQRFVDAELSLPTTKRFIRHIEVRKRGT
jgi:hypothetical protein